MVGKYNIILTISSMIAIKTRFQKSIYFTLVNKSYHSLDSLFLSHGILVPIPYKCILMNSARHVPGPRTSSSQVCLAARLIQGIQNGSPQGKENFEYIRIHFPRPSFVLQALDLPQV